MTEWDKYSGHIVKHLMISRSRAYVEIYSTDDIINDLQNRVWASTTYNIFRGNRGITSVGNTVPVSSIEWLWTTIEQLWPQIIFSDSWL